MLLGRYTCTGDLITLGMELSATFHFDKRPYVDILEHVISSHLAGTKCITPI